MTATLRQCVGVTGSQRGMTMHQLRVAYLLLRELKKRGYTQLRHGDCIGADEDMALIAWAMGYEIVGHPPDNTGRRAYFPSDSEERPEPYLIRNHNVVRKCQYLLAAPEQTHIILRDGAWATVRYAVGYPRAGSILWRNGTTLRLSQVDLTEPVQQGA